MSGTSKENRKNKRVHVQGPPLSVVLSSIGTPVRYPMETSDLSYTGLFLNFDKPNRFPFTPDSLLEIWLELAPQETIFFNGKMARIVLPESEQARESGPGIAIRIVQIQRADEEKLRVFVDDNMKQLLDKNKDVA